MEGGFWEHFKAVGDSGEFELKICWEKIHPGFNDSKDSRFTEKMKAQFIESVTLWLVGSGRTKQLESSLRMSDENIIVAFPATFSDQMKKDFTQGAFFLSMKFSASALSHLPGFRDYDYASPWNIQVGIYDAWGRDVVPEKQEKGVFGKFVEKSGIAKASTDASSWQIMRHKRFGEVPYFDWRMEQWPDEFTYLINKKT